MKIEQWPIDKPKPYRLNPRKIGDAAVTKVAASIEEFGFRQPIVVDKAGVVIIGHTRLQAAKALKMESVPVHVADLDDVQARALRIADNRTNEEAEWDQDILRDEIANLTDAGLDAALTGFDEAQLERLAAGIDIYDDAKPQEFQPGNADQQGKLDEKKPITCPHCGTTFTP